MDVLILGSTGLVGASLLQKLIADTRIDSIHMINRKPQKLSHDKVVEHIGTYSDLPQIMDTMPQIHTLYSCLGTTKSQTPDQQQYRQLEKDYPTVVAEHLLHRGLAQLHYISAIGADADSRIFYTRTKGQAEQALASLEIPRLYLYRPSLITGDRRDNRLAERVGATVMRLLNPLMIGSLRKYRSITASTIADSMMYHTFHSGITSSIVESDQIQDTAALLH